MRKIYTIIFCAAIVAFSAAADAPGRELDVSVSINYEQIPIDQREDILTMREDVETYLNSMSYRDAEWEGDPIKVDITIYIMSRRGNSYSGRLFVVSSRALYQQEGSSVAVRVLDDQWSFPYSRNAVLTHQRNQYDRFTSMLDFYMCIVIGMDLDSYGELDGLEMYERARQIWQNGSAEGIGGYDAYSEPGEFTKYNLVSDLTNQRYNRFRELIFAYYVDGLDLMASDREQALANLDGVIDDMIRFKNKLASASVLLQFFFDTKHLEFADLFKDYYDAEEVFRKLQYLDPGHSTTYQDALEGR